MEVATVPAWIQQSYGIDGDERDLMKLLDEEAPLIAAEEDEQADNAIDAEVEDIDEEEWQDEPDESEEEKVDGDASKTFTERSRIVRVPNFDSGMISEPMLAFGGKHFHVDPKTGLALYGPYSLAGHTGPTLSAIKIGIVGPASMIADAEAWLQACRGTLTNDGTQPFLYPHFPGMNRSGPFQCDLALGDVWRETIKESAYRTATSKPEFADRVKAVIGLYVKSIEILAGREPRPDIVLCCLPQNVIDTCTVQKRRPRPTKLKTAGRRPTDRNQMGLFENGGGVGTETEEWGHQNLRRGLKAEAMQFGVPTQLVWPRTLRLSAESNLQNRTQDIATRAWNFFTAIYHKAAGGAPWRLAELEPGACFVGISFFREILSNNPRMRTSMAQAFTAAGDGYVLRGHTFEGNDREAGRTPHLDKRVAASLLREVIDLYRKQNRDSLPTRIVVHKSSRFWEEELAGLEEACESVPRHDFIALGPRGLQFYRTGDYPPLRGTYVKFSDSDLLLYTSGYVPFLRTYAGARVPQPLEILEHYGDSPWDTVLREVLSLTKMNWNTADFAGSDPITLAFSRKVGQIWPSCRPVQRCDRNIDSICSAESVAEL
ncbi:MAG: hypothetical protein IT168_15780 [Bryobacterales bacterium]|nr:hypothetical protein [Bryobacterales bacterium]